VRANNLARGIDDALDVEEQTTVLRFQNHAFVPLPSGGLYWPAEATLLVADLHLEKMSSFARAGQFLPPYDTGQTLRSLAEDIRRTGAKRLIALGDNFHRDEGTKTLLPADADALSQMVSATEWIWIGGNHDPAPHDLGGRCCAELALKGLALRHEPKRGVAGGLIAGHLHPAARISLNGRSTRRPCFVADETLLILPAYGSSTGSINILGPAFRDLLDLSALQVFMVGRDRVYPVSAKRLVRGR